jgi:hypothetical protein
MNGSAREPRILILLSGDDLPEEKCRMRRVSVNGGPDPYRWVSVNGGPDPYLRVSVNGGPDPYHRPGKIIPANFPGSHFAFFSLCSGRVLTGMKVFRGGSLGRRSGSRRYRLRWPRLPVHDEISAVIEAAVPVYFRERLTISSRGPSGHREWIPISLLPAGTPSCISGSRPGGRWIYSPNGTRSPGR